MNLNNFFKELKRRNVFKAALAYIVVSWVILQVASILFPAFQLSDLAIRYLFYALLVLFPVWILISWYYEITPEGFKRTVEVAPENSISGKTSDRLNYVILGALAVAIILFSVTIYQNSTKSENPSAISSEENNDENEDEILERSVAVLAFADMSPKKDQEYFSDGISEEILNYLAKNDELRVISRTSSFSFKGTNTDIKEIGEKLNANYVLEGSVRKADSILRVTAQLINTGTGEHLWSETYDRKMNDIFKIQDEIAEAVSRNLHASLTGIEIPSVDTEAYTKFLQAKELYDRYTEQALESGWKIINEAIAIDSSYAPMWLLKSKLTMSEKAYNNELSDVAKERIHNTAFNQSQKATELDKNYAEAYAYLGKISRYRGDFNAVKNFYEKAFRLQPNNAEVLRRLSEYYGLSPEQRIILSKKSLELDPLDQLAYGQLGLAFVDNKEYEKALKAFKTYFTYEPYEPGHRAMIADVYANNGQKEEALKLLAKETSKTSKDMVEMFIAILFNEDNKLHKLEAIEKQYGKQYPYIISQAYALLNEKENAYFWLEKAINAKSIDITSGFIKTDNYMDNLREDERFKELLSGVDFPKPLDLELSKIKLKD